LLLHWHEIVLSSIERWAREKIADEVLSQKAKPAVVSQQQNGRNGYVSSSIPGRARWEKFFSGQGDTLFLLAREKQKMVYYREEIP